MFLADMHCDTISKLYYELKRGERTNLLSNHLQIDLIKLKKANYILQNFAVFVDTGIEKHPYQCAKGLITTFKNEINNNKNLIRQVTTVEEIFKNQKNGRISALLTLEEGDICEGDEKKLEELYEDGVRMMTFTWNYENSLATKEGLTSKGISFLSKMEALGILPDVSHLSKAGFYDVYRYSTKPFVASHSNAVSLCNHKRNLSDDMIRKIAEKGGVIGVNFYGVFLENEPENGIYYSKVNRIADHIMHMIHVGGISCVGLGTDFDGFNGSVEITDCSQMFLLIQELKSRNLTESEIEAVCYRNIINVYKETFKK